MAYYFLEHTADIRMSVDGKTLEALFRDALLGLVKATKPSGKGSAQRVKRTIILDAPDITALLIDFLNRALIWIYTKHETYTDVKFQLLEDQSLRAELTGFIAKSFGEDIKAVTYHEADVKKTAQGGWATKIVFDI